MSELIIRGATDADLQAITDIYNEAVLERMSSADIEPRTLAQRKAWVDSHEPRDRYPVVVVESADGQIMAFGSLSRFHERAGYDGVVELSYYVGSAWRRQGGRPPAGRLAAGRGPAGGASHGRHIDLRRQ